VDIEQVWEALADVGESWQAVIDKGVDGEHIVISGTMVGSYKCAVCDRVEDATLIANAPQWLRQMADELEQLREENARLQKHVPTCPSCGSIDIVRGICYKCNNIEGGNDDIR